MHELSLLQGVIEVVDKQLRSRPEATVSTVGLEVGSMSGVVIPALEASWEIARAQTCCAHANLDITPIAATVWCPNCHELQEIDAFFAWCCPVCETPTLDIRSGKEFTIAFIDIDTDSKPNTV